MSHVDYDVRNLKISFKKRKQLFHTYTILIITTTRQTIIMTTGGRKSQQQMTRYYIYVDRTPLLFYCKNKENVNQDR